MEEVKVCLVEVRANRNVQENMKQVDTRSSRINGSLAMVEGYAQDLETGIGRVRSGAMELSDRIHRWLLIAALGQVFLLLWLAVAQLSLTVHRWKLFRRQAD